DLYGGGGALPDSAPPPAERWSSGGDVLLRVGVEQRAAAGAAQPVAGALVVAEQARDLGGALADGPALHHRTGGHVGGRGARQVPARVGLQGGVGGVAAAAGGVVGRVVHGVPSIGFLAGGSVLRDGGGAAQAQTVAHDEHTGKGHRGAGQHGVEHAERGDGDRGRVVGERPEQ